MMSPLDKQVGRWHLQNLHQRYNGFKFRRMHSPLVLVHSRRRDKTIHPGKNAELLLRQATQKAGLFQSFWQGRTVSVIMYLFY